MAMNSIRNITAVPIVRKNTRKTSFVALIVVIAYAREHIIAPIVTVSN